MNSRRYLLALMLGLLAGIAWGTSADFTPDWYERLVPWQQTAMWVSPLIALFVCSAMFEWWHWRAYAACSVMAAVAMTIVSEVNDRTYGCVCCRGESWTAELPVMLFLAAWVGLINVLAWGLGRGARHLLLAWRHGVHAD